VALAPPTAVDGGLGPGGSLGKERADRREHRWTSSRLPRALPGQVFPQRGEEGGIPEDQKEAAFRGSQRPSSGERACYAKREARTTRDASLSASRGEIERATRARGGKPGRPASPNVERRRTDASDSESPKRVARSEASKRAWRPSKEARSGAGVEAR
jgi:hypothetical protein